MVATAALSVLLPLMMLTGLTMSPEWMRSCPGSSIYSADANPRRKSASAMVFQVGPIRQLVRTVRHLGGLTAGADSKSP